MPQDVARGFWLALTLAWAGACSGPAEPDCRDTGGGMELSGRVTVGQGLVGVVQFWEGNFMPMVGPGCSDARILPVSRAVHVYELTHRSQATPDADRGSAFSIEFATRRVATVQSDQRGFFQVALEPGRYTLAVVEEGRLYANRWDSEGNVFPVEVKAGSVSLVPINITHRAAF